METEELEVHDWGSVCRMRPSEQMSTTLHWITASVRVVGHTAYMHWTAMTPVILKPHR